MSKKTKLHIISGVNVVVVLGSSKSVGLGG